MTETWTGNDAEGVVGAQQQLVRTGLMVRTLCFFWQHACGVLICVGAAQHFRTGSAGRKQQQCAAATELASTASAVITATICLIGLITSTSICLSLIRVNRRIASLLYGIR